MLNRGHAMNYQVAIGHIRDKGTGSVNDIVDAIAWGLAEAANEEMPAVNSRDIASWVYSALTNAGFRVVKL